MLSISDRQGSAHQNHREIHSRLLERLFSVRQEVTSIGEAVETREPCALLVGMQIGATENNMEAPQKI